MNLCAMGIVAAAGLAIVVPQAAAANDSAAAIGLGGLELTRNAAISMDSEDLYISAGEVRVHRGGVAILSLLASRAHRRQVREAHRSGRLDPAA